TLVREWIGRGASERRALAVIGMSASALRYCPREDRNGELRERICALAHRHRRYGVGMIYLKLRQEGRIVNYKRVERLYREQQLQVRRRKRKKVPIGERQPLLRPSQANQVWSMDFVFDRTA
ncbi:IS3 family transposase, partial [Xanthomonas campestris pv. campestris]|nr:IS3 family transposase [Xanthomonas campestris pv. campestris]MEB1399703.1 IS3 family transposase [Xanthomonas campestris pv. campestris]